MADLAMAIFLRCLHINWHIKRFKRLFMMVFKKVFFQEFKFLHLKNNLLKCFWESESNLISLGQEIPNF